MSGAVSPALAQYVREVYGDQADEVLGELTRYGNESWHNEVDRVQRDIVFLAGGDVERVSHFVDMARHDYRDVLMFAEYPPDPDAPRSYAALMERLGLDPDNP